MDKRAVKPSEQGSSRLVWRGGRTWLAGAAGLLLLAIGLAHILGLLPSPRVGPRLSANEPARRPAPEFALFEPFLAKYRDLTYDQLVDKLGKPRSYLQQLSFDPTSAKYYDRVKEKMELTAAEIELFKKNGLVGIDQNRRHSFASAYYQIYAQDLPVLVTSDSIMHALHRSYDDILMELEMTLFTWSIGQILEDCHTRLADQAGKNQDATLDASYKDVDLYLTVARNLLAGAGADGKEPENGLLWNGDLLVRSKLGSDAEARARLKDIQSLKIQVPMEDPPTAIYGGERWIDYSQFKPRGHYSKETLLKRYFRTMMWLGRADTGWNVLPPDPQSGLRVASDRELRNAVLLVELLQAGDSMKQLQVLDDIINFMVGRSDNFTVFALRDLLRETGIRGLADARDAQALDRLKKGLRAGKHARPMIRSQSILSDPRSPSPQVLPPAIFQMFGQRFIIDSFVLSQVVFDSILFENKKQGRMMPQGLDVMAALGNDEAVPLLRSELELWNYSGNLMACREYVNKFDPGFWKDNLYHLWLDSLRTLDDDLSAEKNFPEAMRMQAWQRKQLQTQLASWAELRHDTILYAKQSYTATAKCEYPAGYVEPYPEFYAKVRFFAEEAARLFGKADYTLKNAPRANRLKVTRDDQVRFFKNMASVLARLETLAKKELKAEPFDADDVAFIKKTVDSRGGGSGAPRYDGWYCRLFYGEDSSEWEPTIADVHTDPESRSCLQVGVGDANFLVIAIDNEKDRLVHVGPVFSYYEFTQSAEHRLTDEQWQQRIMNRQTPPRPEWTRLFQAPARP
jgi:hypothetical protein